VRSDVEGNVSSEPWAIVLLDRLRSPVNQIPGCLGKQGEISGPMFLGSEIKANEVMGLDQSRS
jgi:hypothetical protein